MLNYFAQTIVASTTIIYVITNSSYVMSPAWKNLGEPSAIQNYVAI